MFIRNVSPGFTFSSVVQKKSYLTGPDVSYTLSKKVINILFIIKISFHHPYLTHQTFTKMC